MSDQPRKAQEGFWWIINTNPGKPPVIYWTGGLYHDGRVMLSFDPNQAAQFDSKEQALFNWEMIAKPTVTSPVEAEEHGWGV